MRRLAAITLAVAAITVRVAPTASAETPVAPSSPASPPTTQIVTQNPVPSTNGSTVDPQSLGVLTGRYTVKPWAGSLYVPPQFGLPAGHWPIAGGYIENGNGQIDVWFPLGGTFPIPIVQAGITPQTIWGYGDDLRVIVALTSPDSDDKYSGTVWISIPAIPDGTPMPFDLTDLTLIPA